MNAQVRNACNGATRPLHGLQYLAQLALWSVLFGIAAGALGLQPLRFVVAFAAIFLVTLGIYALGLMAHQSSWRMASLQMDLPLASCCPDRSAISVMTAPVQHAAANGSHAKRLR